MKTKIIKLIDITCKLIILYKYKNCKKEKFLFKLSNLRIINLDK